MHVTECYSDKKAKIFLACKQLLLQRDDQLISDLAQYQCSHGSLSRLLAPFSSCIHVCCMSSSGRKYVQGNLTAQLHAGRNGFETQWRHKRMMNPHIQSACAHGRSEFQSLSIRCRAWHETSTLIRKLWNYYQNYCSTVAIMWHRTSRSRNSQTSL